MKGFHHDDPRVQKELMYWTFAHAFHFTPEQVDALPYERMVYLIALEQENERMQKTK